MVSRLEWPRLFWTPGKATNCPTIAGFRPRYLVIRVLSGHRPLRTMDASAFDTGPLAHFARAGWLGVFEALVGSSHVIIPVEVVSELQRADGHEHALGRCSTQRGSNTMSCAPKEVVAGLHRFLLEVASTAALIILAIFSLLENIPSPVVGKQGGGANWVSGGDVSLRAIRATVNI